MSASLRSVRRLAFAFRCRLTLLIACLVAGASPAASGAELLLDHWDYRMPSSIGEDLYSVSHDGTQFYAAGDGGLLMRSADGMRWTTVIDPRNDGPRKSSYTRIVPAGGTWLAFGRGWFSGSSGGTSYSHDGVNWIFPNATSSRTPLDAVYFEDRYLILAWPSFLYSAEELDGAHTEVLANAMNGDFQALAAGPDRLVIVGTNGLTLHSDNGIDWDPNDAVTTNALRDVEHLGDAFYAVGAGETILRSPDGITWTVVHETTDGSPLDLTSISRLGDLWIAVGGSTALQFIHESAVLQSTNGVDWTPLAGLPEGRSFYGITAANGRWVVVGEGGMRLTSTDAVVWEGPVSSPRNPFGQLASNGSKVLMTAVGNQILATRDGITWERHQMTGNAGGEIVWFDDRFYARGGSGTLSRSVDGLTWESITAPSTASINFIDVAGDALFVGFDDISQYRSTDGVNWEPMILPNYAWVRSVAGGDNKYALATQGGYGFISSDGITWTETPQPTSTSEIIYGKGRFVGNRNGDIAYSDDGVDWVSAGVNIYQKNTKIDFTGEAFVVGGYGGQIAWSPDGISWQTIFTPLSGTMTGLVSLGDTLIASNLLGTIIQSRAAPPAGGLVNISTRAPLLANDTLIAGFAISGGTKALLVRGTGESFSLAGTITDPIFKLYRDNTELPGNDDWTLFGDQSRLAATSAAVFAFPLQPNSKEAAGVFDLAPGTVTAVIENKPDSPGIALAEVFDADTEAGPTVGRLVNLSARGTVLTGDSIMIAGFVVRAGAPAKIMIRAVGPGLGALGVPNALADPQITIFSGNTVIATNDDWDDIANHGQTSFLADETGAFALAPGSQDAALVMYLQPGVYTAHVTGVAGVTGTALVEVYLLD